MKDERKKKRVHKKKSLKVQMRQLKSPTGRTSVVMEAGGETSSPRALPPCLRGHKVTRLVD